MNELSKKYSNGEVTIVWKPGMCAHSTICWRASTGLPKVFRPLEKPWIRPEAASSLQLVEQVKKCPSGALSYYWNEGRRDSGDGEPGGVEELGEGADEPGSQEPGD